MALRLNSVSENQQQVSRRFRRQREQQSSTSERSVGGVSVKSRRAPQIENANKINQSNWLLTISTNKRPSSNEEADQICDALEGYFEKFVDDIPKYVVWRETEFGVGKWNSHYVKDINIEYTCEVGSYNIDDYDVTLQFNKFGGRVHGHITVFMRHLLHVHLNYRRIREDATAYLEKHGIAINGLVHFDGKGLPAPENAIRYLSKDSPHREVVEEQAAEFSEE